MPGIPTINFDEFRQSELQVIPDSDHFLPFEKGPEVAQILLNYLGNAQPL